MLARRLAGPEEGRARRINRSVCSIFDEGGQRKFRQLTCAQFRARSQLPLHFPTISIGEMDESGAHTFDSVSILVLSNP